MKDWARVQPKVAPPEEVDDHSFLSLFINITFQYGISHLFVDWRAQAGQIKFELTRREFQLPIKTLWN